MNKKTKLFLQNFINWSSSESCIQALALVGSYAKNKESIDSDVDLVIITNNPEKYLTDTNWVNKFGKVMDMKIEDSGLVQELRVFYNNGLEIEYGITTENWISYPLDKDTKKVISDGMKILFDRKAILSNIKLD